MECLNISSIEPSVISPPCMCAMGTLLKTAATTDDDIAQEIDALQVAYSMGGMSIKAYNMEVTNPDQDDNAADQSVTEIALGFAF